MRSLKTFFRFPISLKIMCFEALFLSAYYRYLILKRPFAQISKKIGTLGYETEQIPYQDARMLIKMVQTAVGAVCGHTPWESKCLVQALTAKRMLNRRGLSCTMYMGVALEPDGEMAAHAWLRCGVLYVTGGNGAKTYTITTIFGDEK